MAMASSPASPRDDEAPARAAPPGRTPWHARPAWRWARRLAVTGFLLGVATLLVIQARGIAWREVLATLQAYPGGVLAAAAGLGALSHVIYASFDLIGRRFTGHALPAPAVMGITFVSYAFNLNMGVLVGAVGMRLRLYTRLGLDAATVTRIVGSSMLTNWLGYCVLAGLVFALLPPPIPEDWRLGRGALRVLGGLLVLAGAGYLLLCAFARRREWRVRGQEISLPGVRMASVQLLLSVANWAVMGAALHVLLRGHVPYLAALGVLLIGAVAGLLSRIPAGLGVLEAVVVALLGGGALSQNALLAAVLGYRVVYYWLPLCVAALLFVGLELGSRRLRAATAPPGAGATAFRAVPK